ncbi:alpha/beta hydrolase [Natronoglycomyces albus]|uniref:DUF1023 domain-containing protein n=1 Tax=Natronoglycomyces albus TaxID=2811108 RepID=A0A895XG70_9ACTN|nr:alpha/beta hydrolase [Natronoglycomyces albus]QSB04861.1 hypothetical protein JQS30_13995 [Natronoglycomyces albus]
MANKVDTDLEQMRSAADETDQVLAEIRTDSQSVDSTLFNLMQTFKGQTADDLSAFRFTFSIESALITGRLNDIAMALRHNIRNYGETDQANAQGITGASGGSGSLAESLRGPDGAARPDGNGFLSQAEANNEAPPGGASPQEVADWWDSLSEDQQQHILENSPENVADVNGVPASARDIANRAILDDKLTQNAIDLEAVNLDIAQQDEGTFLNPNRELDALIVKREQLQSELVRMDNLKSEIAEPYLGLDHLLLGFDESSESGRPIVFLGDPGTSDHLSVHVTGTDSNLDPDSFNELMDRTRNLAEDAINDSGDSVAVALWFDYDAPQGISNAISEQPASEGAPGLTAFSDGMRATSGSDSVSYLGHSYGSTIIGHAAASSDGLNTDRIMLIGSPGAGAIHASEFGIGAENVYATTASGDIIGWAGLPGDNDVLVHGTDPVHENFGAHVLESDNRTGDAKSKGNHSGYYDPGNQFRENSSNVITDNVGN